MLQCLHLDKLLLQQQNTEKLQGIKNYCVCVQLGQILDKKMQKDKTNQLWEWKQGDGNKIRVLFMPPAHTTTKEVGQTPKLPLQSNPSLHISNQLTNFHPGNKQGKLTCFSSLLQPQEPQ